MGQRRHIDHMDDAAMNSLYESIGHNDDSGASARHAIVRRVAAKLFPDAKALGLVLKDGQTGVVNVIANRAGLFVVDTNQIVQLNQLTPSIGIATQVNLKRVIAGTCVASLQIHGGDIRDIDVGPFSDWRSDHSGCKLLF